MPLNRTDREVQKMMEALNEAYKDSQDMRISPTGRERAYLRFETIAKCIEMVTSIPESAWREPVEGYTTSLFSEDM